jgi:hypothetical protein
VDKKEVTDQEQQKAVPSRTLNREILKSMASKGNTDVQKTVRYIRILSFLLAKRDRLDPRIIQ